jgi:hypothetical protein
VAPLTDALGAAAAPLTDTLAPSTAPLADVLAPAAAPGANAIAPATGSLADALAPGATPVEHATPPLADALTPATAPLAQLATPVPGALAPAVTPVSEAVVPATAPAGDAVASWTASIAPVSPTLASAGAPTPGAALVPAADAVVPPSHLVVQSSQPHELPIDNAFPFDPIVLAHGLGTWEARIVITGILGGILAGRAAGIGMIDFTQPVLQACNAGVRAAFSEVRLLPCRQTVASVRAAAADRPGGTAAGSTRQSIARRDNDPHDGTATGEGYGVAPIVRALARPISWSVPAARTMLLRLFACMLAALSTTIAGRAGLARHRRDRAELPYRRRLHS